MTNSSSTVLPTRVLRASLMSGRRTNVARASFAPTLPFALVLIAVTLEYCISGNVLDLIGLKYNDLGGSPFEKFHPATYVAIFGALAVCCSKSGLAYAYSRATPIILFCIFIFSCAVFSAINVGSTGAGVYIDTYLSAGALAVAMVKADDRQRLILARLLLVLCAINVLISLLEYVHQDHFIPVQYTAGNGKSLTDIDSEDFRPTALYSHPLTGALATSFAVFLTLTTRLRFVTKAACFGLFVVGLLSFGGRAALLTTLGVIGLQIIVTLIRDMMRGRVNGRLLAMVCLAVVTLGPLTGYLLADTPVGERIAARAYFDDSAEVRAMQWRVFDKLTPHQFMFGTPAADLERVYEQVGLRGVENPFILIFLNLGLLGLPIYVCAMLVYFIYLRRAYPDSGWLALAGVIILFSSNSIGVKTPDLFMLTASAITMKGSFENLSVRLRKLRVPATLLSLRARTLTAGVAAQATGLSAVRRHHGLAPEVTQLLKRRM